MTQHTTTTKFIEHSHKYLLGYVVDKDDINFIIRGSDKVIQTSDLFDICAEWERIRKKKDEETLCTLIDAKCNPKVY